jgi:hypothetical protein
MKKLYVLLFLLSAISFGQTRTFVDSLTASDTTYHYVARSFEFAILTITLPNANDTVNIYVGTAEASPKYGKVGLVDMLTNDNVLTVTGNTTTNRKYFIKWGYKQKYIALESTTNSATLYYTLEAY